LGDRRVRGIFIVRDANGQALAYVYFEEEPGRRTAAKLLTRDEARRIAANIARLPEMVRKPEGRLRVEGPAPGPAKKEASTVGPRPRYCSCEANARRAE